MGYQAKQTLLGIFASVLAFAGSDGVEWNQKAAQLYDKARYAEAENLFRRALEAFDADGEREGVNRALTVENLAVMLRAEGRYRESEQMHREALPRLEALTGKDSAETARAVSNMAALYWSVGKLENAEQLALRAEGIFDELARATPGERADRFANRQILATIYLSQKRYENAEQLLRSASAIGGPIHHVMAYSNLSVAAIGMKDNARAEEYARQAIEVGERDLPGHPVTATALNNLAQACRFQGKYLEAERRYRQAIAIWEDTLGTQHPDVARGMMNLAAFYHERAREAGAEDLYLRAAEILERAFGKRDAQALVVRNELADVLRAEGRFTESEKLARSTVAEMEGVFREDDPRMTRALENYARLLAETNRKAQAKKVWARTLR